MALVEGLRGFVPFSQISSVSSCLTTVKILRIINKHILVAGILVAFKTIHNMIYDDVFFSTILSESSS